MTDRDCKRCKGTGKVDGWHGESRDCRCCKGTGKFSEPDFSAILELITTKRGAKDGKRKFRASCTKNLTHYSNQTEARAYFVWRMVRFHSGQDVTMPVMASLAITGDSFEPELDAFASAIAKRAFGTDMAGAMRWAGLLGGIPENAKPAGLPASAYEGGPVSDDLQIANIQPRLDKVKEIASEFGDKEPASICTCSHTGDGANSEHHDALGRHLFRSRAGSKGHGSCKKCGCTHFTWKAHRPEFLEALQKAINRD